MWPLATGVPAGVAALAAIPQRGLAALAASFAVDARLLSGSLGIFGITLLWDALECVRQQRRVVRGHAPANPQNAVTGGFSLRTL